MFQLIEKDLLIVEDRLLNFIQTPVQMLESIGQHLVQAGGKRLRPALYLLSCRLGPNDDDEKFAIASAIELIHMATLVHDDVIDVADTRRGRPTANVIFGNHASVLAGDFLFAKAFSLIAQHSTGSMLKRLTDVICLLCEGEILQEKDLFRTEQTMKDYEARILRKTADFIAVSCQIGALTASQPQSAAKAMYDYGYSIGMAFQITDDILDFTANEKTLGKPCCNDLKQGIITLPALYALEHSPKADYLRSLIEAKQMSEEQITEALEIIQSAGAIEYSYEQVEKYIEQAKRVLPSAMDSRLYEAFVAIADFIGKRNY